MTLPTDESRQMQAQADEIRSANVLGRSGLLSRLFEFLLRQSLAGHRPKEVEIAIDVFGKGADFDVSQDATTRVYIHKLRRRLEDHYAAAGAGEPVRIVIPKGEYRLALEQVAAAPTPQPEQPAATSATGNSRKLGWLGAILVASLLANVALVAVHLTARRQQAQEFAGVRDHAVWAPLLDDGLPIYVVLGDYYIFGEADPAMGVKRMIREFHVNSARDLQQEMYLDPQLVGRYLDLDLSYLPVASAFGLRHLLPILAAKNKHVEVVLTSELTAHMIKSAHIVYVGYLSGMGMLRDVALKPSRFSIGETYDELIDTRSKRHYVSEAGVPVNGEILYHDYGFLSSFKGPNDNQILIVAGTRDIAVAHTAEVLANARALGELSKSVADAHELEALYEVSGMDRTSVNGRLVISSALDPRRTWATQDSADPQQ